MHDGHEVDTYCDRHERVPLGLRPRVSFMSTEAPRILLVSLALLINLVPLTMTCPFARMVSEPRPQRRTISSCPSNNSVLPFSSNDFPRSPERRSAPARQCGGRGQRVAHQADDDRSCGLPFSKMRSTGTSVDAAGGSMRSMPRQPGKHGPGSAVNCTLGRPSAATSMILPTRTP